MSLGSVRYPVTAWVSSVLGTPIKYNDPSGHDVTCPGNDAEECLDLSSVIIYGGSNPDKGIEEPGPAVGDQLGGWVEDDDGYQVRATVQYPGSKKAQAENGREAEEAKVPTGSPVIYICYSAGTESCLMAAKKRIEEGEEVAAIILLGPTWEATNENGVDTNFKDPNGGWAGYMDDLLEGGVDILVVDDGVWGTDRNASDYSAPEGVTGTYTYQRMLIPHYDSGGYIKWGTNMSSDVKSFVYDWLATR